jgi:hypothetical protein
MPNSLKYLGSLVAIGIGLWGYHQLVPKDDSFGLFSAQDGQATLSFLLTFAATVTGVVLGSLYRGLSKLRDAGVPTVPPGYFAGLFRSVDMWIGLVASPIVFALLLKASEGMALPAVLILALENGFCALIIIEGFTRAKNPPQEEQSSV